MGQRNGSSGPGADGPHGHPQPRNFLRPCLLLLLWEEPAYGYELREKLAKMSPTQWDMGTVYRALNTMEEDGLVASSWERSDEGPRRRRYDISPPGRSLLDLLAGEMSAMRDVIAGFLTRYRDDCGSAGSPGLHGVSSGVDHITRQPAGDLKAAPQRPSEDATAVEKRLSTGAGLSLTAS